MDAPNDGEGRGSNDAPAPSDATHDTSSADAFTDQDAMDDAPAEASDAGDATLDAPSNDGDADAAPDGPVTVLSVATGGGAFNGGIESAHTCAVTSTHGVKCWGHGGYGELGDGTMMDRPKPVDVVGLGGPVVSVAVSTSHSCAVLQDGHVQCWGYNGSGQLGNGSDAGSPVPVTVFSLDNAVAVTAASNGDPGLGHTCAVGADNSVYCWGDRSNGELGDGITTTIPQILPVLVKGLSATAVSAGHRHTCALTTGTDVMCWGDNSNNQFGLGAGNTAPSNVPVSTGVSFASAMSAGGIHTCAIVINDVLCWGGNVDGQCGDGTTNRAVSPVHAVGVTTAVSVAAANAWTCALLNTGNMQCWGYGADGELGDQMAAQSSLPVNILGGFTAVSMTPSCAVSSTGQIRCWGDGQFGQIGDNQLLNRLIPVPVSGLP
jgi:alpha-tubulin suppressor-like RCC1 family protein